jgi:hypothetical protein
MPSLSELQTAMAHAVLATDPAARQLPATWFAGDGERGLRIHRNNILGACCNALRLSYPTLERLIGSQSFDALAADYARHAPPAAPMLAVYGEGFANFVSARAVAVDRRLLDEVARFDWLFERVAQSPVEAFNGPAVLLLGSVQLQLCNSLQLFSASFAVDELRADTAVADGADGQGPRHLALWRRAAGVAVQRLSEPSAALLGALLADAGLEAALAAAAAAAESANELPALIEAEVLRASFARLVRH